MNRCFVHRLRLKKEVKYTSLMEDQESLSVERSPSNSTSSVANGMKIFRVSRRLFHTNNRTFKIGKKDDTSARRKNKERFHSILTNLQNQLHSLRTGIRNTLQGYHGATKTPCVTPNRKIRHMLGRTPTKLYSPFSIETPPNQWRRKELQNRLENTPVALNEWFASPKHNCAAKDKVKSVSAIFYN